MPRFQPSARNCTSSLAAVHTRPLPLPVFCPICYIACCGSRVSPGAVRSQLAALVVGVIQMSSNKFLQRFEGRIQTVGKTGIQGLFGIRNHNTTAHTNTNFYNQQNNKTATSLRKHKPTLETPAEHKISMQEISRQPQKHEDKDQGRTNGRSSEKALFLPSISHPYHQGHRKTEEEPQAGLSSANEAAKQTAKKKTNYSSRSLQKRKESAAGKLEGLEANTGGEEWLLRKKKLQKQAFAQQVKLSCRQMPKIPKQQKRSVQQQKRQEDGLGQSWQQS